MKNFILRDSGKRMKYKTGAMRERPIGKGRFDLISPFAHMRVAKISEKGALKYSDRNWENGEPISRFIDSAERHIAQFKMGMEDEDHLAQAAWNLFAAMHMQETKPEMDDMPHYMRDKE